MTYVPPGKGEQPFSAIHKENLHIRREIGDVRWCTVEEALQLIRPGNKEKKKVLLRASQLLTQFCPIRLGASPKWVTLDPPSFPDAAAVSIGETAWPQEARP